MWEWDLSRPNFINQLYIYTISYFVSNYFNIHSTSHIIYQPRCNIHYLCLIICNPSIITHSSFIIDCSRLIKLIHFLHHHLTSVSIDHILVDQSWTHFYWCARRARTKNYIDKSILCRARAFISEGSFTLEIFTSIFENIINLVKCLWRDCPGYLGALNKTLQVDSLPFLTMTIFAAKIVNVNGP